MLYLLALAVGFVVGFVIGALSGVLSVSDGEEIVRLRDAYRPPGGCSFVAGTTRLARGSQATES